MVPEREERKAVREGRSRHEIGQGTKDCDVKKDRQQNLKETSDKDVKE